MERASCPFDGDFVHRISDDIVDLGLEPFTDAELAHLRALLADGTVRRFAAVVNHRRVGFVANALTLWRVPSEKLDAAGAALASSPSVSHCYARATQPDWPYALYAMVHARSEDDLSATVRTLAERIGAIVGQETKSLILPTIREYKKTSMRYFEK